MFNKRIILLSSFLILSFIYGQKNNNDISDVSIINKYNNSNFLGANYISGWNTGSFWMGIYCYNVESIAGFQFNLPEDLQLINVVGLRAKNKNFNIPINKEKGMFLGFSYGGDTIEPSLTELKDKNMLVKLHLKVLNNEKRTFNIKSILASSKGERLLFETEPQQIKINNDETITIRFID